MNEKELKVITHYGVLPQLKYFQSEVFELNEAIIRYENEPLNLVGVGNKEHITEEIADVQFMLNQFKRYYGIKTEDINAVMIRKADRQIERIENENSN
jgi:NTP pyrophosphatase (non-canonical NTP hydrolase)